MFAAIQASAGFVALEAAAKTFNSENLWRKRGVAALPTEHSCGWGRHIADTYLSSPPPIAAHLTAPPSAGGNCSHGAKIDVHPGSALACTTIQCLHAFAFALTYIASGSDGTILCFVTGIELGQGLYTKCAQVAAKVLGLPDTSLIEVQLQACTPRMKLLPRPPPAAPLLPRLWRSGCGTALVDTSFWLRYR